MTLIDQYVNIPNKPAFDCFCLPFWKLIYLFHTHIVFAFQLSFQNESWKINKLNETGVRAIATNLLHFGLPTFVRNTEKVAYNITSEASFVYILSGQKFIKNAKTG